MPKVDRPSHQRDSAAGVSLARPRTAWNEAASRLLKIEMVKNGVSYKELARRLEKSGGQVETVSALITRVNRGTFTLAFFLEAATAIGTDAVHISHLRALPLEPERE